MKRSRKPSLVVLTIGHSTRPLTEFLALLQVHQVQRVVDVRTVPRSRTNPQFNRDSLPEALATVGIGYSHLAELGGLRHRRPGSINGAWRNASFQGFADYMQTPTFAAGIDQLLALARQERVVLMCAEAVPWRCHRSMIGDALVVRGVQVEDIMSLTRRQPHRLTPWAHVDGLEITYPPVEPSVPLFPA